MKIIVLAIIYRNPYRTYHKPVLISRISYATYSSVAVAQQGGEHSLSNNNNSSVPFRVLRYASCVMVNTGKVLCILPTLSLGVNQMKLKGICIMMMS